MCSNLCRPSVPAAGQDAEMEIVTVSDPSALAPSDVSAIALDFKVLHPVVITRLGVFPSGTRPELQNNVTVKLLQLDQEVTEPRPLNVMYLVCCFSVEPARYTACGQLEDPVVVLFTASVIDTNWSSLTVCCVVFSVNEGTFAQRLKRSFFMNSL